MPQPTVRDLLLNTEPGTALGALSKVGTPQPSKIGQPIAQPTPDFLDSIVSALKGIHLGGPPSAFTENPLRENFRNASVSTTQPYSDVKPQGAAGNLGPGVSTTPPISSTVSPVPASPVSPAQTQIDWASALKSLSPVNLTDTPTMPKAPAFGLNPKMPTWTNPGDRGYLAGNADALQGLANANSPSNYTKLLGGR